MQLPAINVLAAHGAHSARLKCAEAGRQDHSSGIELLASAGSKQKSAIGFALQARYHLAQVDIGLERFDLFQ
jgi:hypothetical protein